MPAVLSQSDIEALLKEMTGGDDDAASPAETDPAQGAGGSLPRTAGPAGGQVILPLHKRRRAQAEQLLRRGSAAEMPSTEPYDFRRPDKLSKENLRSLEMLHDTFANHYSSSLASYLRTQVQIEPVSVEQLRYDEYIKSISSSLLNVLNVQPLQGQAIFEMEFGILFSMLDRLLGGSGAAGLIARDLTDIERALAENLVELALLDMKLAWKPVSPLTFDVASMDTSAQFMQIAPGSDTVVLIMFEIAMGEHTGRMSMCIPYLLLKPILGRLSTQRWLSSAIKKPSSLHAAGLAQRLRTTKVPCVARLGTAHISVADLVALEVGQTLPMTTGDASEDGAQSGRIGMVDLMIGGQVKFRGRTGLRGKKLAVQIEQIVAAPLDLVSHKEVQ